MFRDMKGRVVILVLAWVMFACDREPTGRKQIQLTGTWRLISGALVEKGDTTVTDYTGDIEMIKIINDTHFAFLNHNVNRDKDSLATQFSAGGGRYQLNGDQYTEHLDYYTDPQWEGNDFIFTVTIQNDTLTQRGVEKVEGTSIDSLNIEKYVRVKEVSQEK